MSIELREAKTAEDLEQYYDLRWRILRQPWTGEQHRGPEVYEEAAFHLTAWQDGKMVGGARLHFLPDREALIKGMAVDQDSAGKGIGSRILQGLEERATASGVKRII